MYNARVETCDERREIGYAFGCGKKCQVLCGRRAHAALYHSTVEEAKRLTKENGWMEGLK